MRIQKTSIIAIAVAGGLCASLAVAQELATYPILGGAKEPQPGYGEIENFTILGYSDLNGWDRPTEIRVSPDGKYAFMASNPPPVPAPGAPAPSSRVPFVWNAPTGIAPVLHCWPRVSGFLIDL